MCSQDGPLNASLGAAVDPSLEPAAETASIPEPGDIATHFTLATSGDVSHSHG